MQLFGRYSGAYVDSFGAADAYEIRRAWAKVEVLNEGNAARMAAYLDYLLRGHVAAKIGHRSSVGDLHDLAIRLHDDFIELVLPDYAVLDEVLLAVHRAADSPIPGETFIVQASTALGILRRTIGESLDETHPHVKKWYERRT